MKSLSQLLTLTPPVIEDPSNEDLWKLLKIGRKVRGLGKKEMMRLVRWGPMAVADFVAEFFETDLLRAAVAARGIFGAALGPWSAGSTALLSAARRRRSASGRQFRLPARRHGRAHRRDGCSGEASRRRNSHRRRRAANSGETRRSHRCRALKWRRNRREMRRFRRRPATHSARLARSRSPAAQLRRKNAAISARRAPPPN